MSFSTRTLLPLAVAAAALITGSASAATYSYSGDFATMNEVSGGGGPALFGGPSSPVTLTPIPGDWSFRFDIEILDEAYDWTWQGTDFWELDTGSFSISDGTTTESFASNGTGPGESYVEVTAGTGFFDLILNLTNFETDGTSYDHKRSLTIVKRIQTADGSLFNLLGELGGAVVSYGSDYNSMSGDMDIAGTGTIVPLPAGAWLILSGFGALTLLRRRAA